MSEPGDGHDPKGLVRESYLIEGITGPECRSILIDWVLSLPAGADLGASAAVLLGRHGAVGHPMTALLTEALAAPAAPRRRGGRAARMADPPDH